MRRCKKDAATFALQVTRQILTAVPCHRHGALTCLAQALVTELLEVGRVLSMVVPTDTRICKLAGGLK
eukprot:s670_g34.t1